MELLIKAAEDGDISDLYRLIPENPRILKQLDDLPFAQTPLHQKGMAEQRGEGVSLLHYVAELCNLTLMPEFLAICPESINAMTIRSETALHIAVKHRNFDATEVLMGWLERAGLLPRCGVANMDLQNFEQRTALDILKRRPHREDKMLQEILKTASNAATYTLSPFAIYLRTKIILFERMIRGGLLVVAVLVATATYSAGINPPGVQHNRLSSGLDCSDGWSAVLRVSGLQRHCFLCINDLDLFLMLPSGIFMMLLQYSLVACYMLSMVIISPTNSENQPNFDHVLPEISTSDHNSVHWM
uniref:PGG domain-containing protein n=1 Tax=Kalanchoe fedtschenkoi TaxID=63787 RepID=A0A7N1A7Z5_KALFE